MKRCREVLVNDVVLPSDRAVEPRDITLAKRRVILGPGLTVVNEEVVVAKCGVLQSKKPNTFWVDSYQKRYVPVKGETVIGIVTAKSGDTFRVDIGASDQATLSYMAFEGATKKYRPDVNIGDLLFARILIANRDFEPEIVCVNSNGKKGRLGVLSGGFLFSTSINLVRKILNEKCPLLTCLSQELVFEMAAGLNGRIWIKGKNVRETIAVGNAILAAEFIKNEDMKDMCTNVANVLSGVYHKSKQ